MHRTVFVLLIAAAVAGVPAAASAQDKPERHVTVIGEGTVHVVPDLAVIQAGVTTQGKSAREASAANNAAMAKVLAALKAGGIPERDIQTARLSIRPVHDARRDGGNRIVGFDASNQVSIKMRALANLAAVLDQTIAAGANDLSGIQFTVSDRSRPLDNARSEAVADARRKAELLAKAAGVRLGRATAIVEDDRPGVPIERLGMRAVQASVPVAVGEQTLRVHVRVTFELLH